MALSPSDIPDNVNEAWFDAIVRHQIGLLRVSGKVRNEIFEILDATEKDIAAQIERRLAAGTDITSPHNQRRLEILLRTIRAIRNQAWTKAADVWEREILDIAKAEPEYLAQAIRTVSPVQVDTILPSTDVLKSIVKKRPFEGKVLREWAKNIQQADVNRIESAIRIGMTQGESAKTIARRVVGTVSQRGRDGVTEITRRQAQGITRTAINSVTNQAKREFFNLNADLFEEELYVATLDARTTPVCRANDGKKFPVGQGPIPPLHFNCRSLRVALLSATALGQRPAKTSTERQLLREYSANKGFRAPGSRAGLPRGHKGPFDDFRRQRIRELTGRVDSSISYGDWLRRQSHTFQNDVLGSTRAKLFRKGELPLDRFVNRNGDELSLSQLARREADAFRAAGLDPDDFR